MKKIIVFFVMISMSCVQKANNKNSISYIEKVSIERSKSIAPFRIIVDLNVNDSIFNLFNRKEIQARLVTPVLNLYNEKSMVSSVTMDLNNAIKNKVRLHFHTTLYFYFNLHECDSVLKLMKRDMKVYLYGSYGKTWILEMCKDSINSAR